MSVLFYSSLSRPPDRPPSPPVEATRLGLVWLGLAWLCVDCCAAGVALARLAALAPATRLCIRGGTCLASVPWEARDAFGTITLGQRACAGSGSSFPAFSNIGFLWPLFFERQPPFFLYFCLPPGPYVAARNRFMPVARGHEEIACIYLTRRALAAVPLNHRKKISHTNSG